MACPFFICFAKGFGCRQDPQTQSHILKRLTERTEVFDVRRLRN